MLLCIVSRCFEYVWSVIAQVCIAASMHAVWPARGVCHAILFKCSTGSVDLQDLTCIAIVKSALVESVLLICNIMIAESIGIQFQQSFRQGAGCSYPYGPRCLGY